MTATLNDVVKAHSAAVELVRMARELGSSLTGPDGLSKQLTKTVFETALSEEITEQLGYEKDEPARAGAGSIRNGTSCQDWMNASRSALIVSA